MTVRTYLAGTFGALVLSWFILVLVVRWIDPLQSAGAGLLLFFLSLFLAVASTAALFGYGIRRIVTPSLFDAYRVRPALRQGILLGVFSDMLLFLQLQRLLRWWITLILVLVFLCIELGFLGYDRKAGRYREAGTSGK